eukprot:TRINITY_DN32469_c0_g1_i1.p2 TRINITY_DN32469_c0_g1~~TRINITY_DN32469_c0_g1_i1.p2  ORF type:complete len:286 (+),score=75.39 TRINITY_DN32469_c0_g1_i1:95-859(+)
MKSAATKHGMRYAEKRTGQDLNGDGYVGRPLSPGRYDPYDDRREPSRREDRRDDRDDKRVYDDDVSGRTREEKKSPRKAAGGSVKSPPNAPRPERTPGKDYEVWPPPGMMYYVDEDPPNGKMERRPPSPPNRREVPRKNGSRTVKITNLSETSTSVQPQWGGVPNQQPVSPHQRMGGFHPMSPQQHQMGFQQSYGMMPTSPQTAGYGTPQRMHQGGGFYPMQQQYAQSPGVMYQQPLSPQQMQPMAFSPHQQYY